MTLTLPAHRVTYRGTPFPVLGWQRAGLHLHPHQPLGSSAQGPPSLCSLQWPWFCACLTGRGNGLRAALLWRSLTVPSPLCSPVNLWKIYKAVEKLGAYEMVRKAPRALSRLASRRTQERWGRGELRELPWPPDRRMGPGPAPPSAPACRGEGEGSPGPLVLCCSKQVSSFPICSAFPELGKLLGPAVRWQGWGRGCWPAAR